MTAAPAKITRPQPQSIIQRSRLFSLLDKAWGKSITWVSAPAGSGKTTLLASYLDAKKLPCIWYQCDEGDADLASFFYYLGFAAQKAAPRNKKPLPLLTPEYRAGIPTFTLRFFEQLWIGMKSKPKFVLVLDNYQDVPADAQFHEMMAHGLDRIPDGIHVVVISRGSPPSAFARLQANDNINMLESGDIRFTYDESKELIQGRIPKLDTRRIKTMYEKTEGWAAGIILMLERQRLHGTGAESATDSAYEGVFDYLAEEILNKTEHKVRDFLLKTAFLPLLSVSLAEELTGDANAGRILSGLNRHNYFTERLSGNGQDYQYHSLFRAFLMSRARAELSSGELSLVLAKTASMLTEARRTEEAAALLAELGDWDGLVRLLADTAGALIVEGRNKTLENLLLKLPENTLMSAPQMLYWLGISKMPFDAEKSRALLEKAFQIFDSGGDVEWALATWAAVVDSIITEHNDYTKLDQWIDWLDGKEDVLDSVPPDKQRETVAYMLFILTVKRPWHPKIGLWAARAEELIRSGTDMPKTMIVGARLLLHYTFFGEVHKAEFMMKNIRPPDSGKIGLRVLSLIQWHVITAAYAALGSGSPVACHDAVNKGLALSREHGIHVFEPLLLYFGAVSSVASGDDATVDRLLGEMVSHRAGYNEMHLAYYISVIGWRDLVKGDARSAADRIRMILSVTERLGHTINSIANHVGLAHALFELGDKDASLQHLAKARDLHGRDTHWLDYMFLATDAYFAFKEGREADGLELTRKAMVLSREQGVIVFVYWRRSVLSLLCTKALEAGIETEYVTSLIRKLKLNPDPSNSVMERWPWPFRIYTMGAFQIVKDDAPLEFSGKTPQKPLELLKALIAFGGTNVPEERLTDVLWPNADGDLAHQSFESALSRLRKLLGSDDCIKYGARQLSIDPLFCWVDSIALEHVLSGIEDATDELLPGIYKDATRLYKGHFLHTDAGREWVLIRSERLKSRLLRAIKNTGRLYERNGQWEQAADCYQKGLDTDPLMEEFYRCLMLCYQKLGRRSEVVALYSRCRDLLQSQLGIKPSPETEAVYSSILKQS